MQSIRSDRGPGLFRPALHLACAFVLFTGGALAQDEAPPRLYIDYLEDSGWHENTGAAPQVVLSFPVVVDKASWVRLYFEEVSLSGDFRDGTGSILRLTALKDGAIQEMDARHLEEWQNSSAYFNGDTVLVEVLAQPGTGWNRVAMRAVDMGLPAGPGKSICGPTDDRILSYDVRAARILSIGCTGWLIDDCAHCMLTAGHCASGTSVAQFNVPLSNSNGTINHPSPDDQYSVDPSSMQDNGGAGVGDDWAYFGVFPNTNTGLTPAEAQGAWYTLVNPPPVASNDIRITGYGTDNTPSTHNQVQQTNVGPLVTSSGSTVQYVTDTTGGNSGSPVIWEQTGEAVGIHTHGGCSSTGGQNSGTGANHPGLRAALASPAGVCSSGINVVGMLPDIVPPGSPVSFEVRVLGTPATGTQVLFHYRFQGGAFQQIVMTSLGANRYGVDMPAPTCGDTPEFYFGYTDETCGPVTNPDGAPANYHSVIVGDEVVVFEDDFQTDKGWTVENLGATTGDWQRGVPVNDPNWAYDPTSDADGSGRCYLTQNALGNTDVDDGAVRLNSPVFDLSDPSSFVRYAYYLYLTDTDGTDRLLVEARSNVGSWTTVKTHTSSGGLTWRTQVITYSDFIAAGVTPSAVMELRFTANDGDTQSIVEAGVDAFFVGGINCYDCAGPVNYCQSAVNSSGAEAIMTWMGTASLAADDFHLLAYGCPPNKFCMFYYGDGQGAGIPFGNGWRCVTDNGGGIYRFPVFQIDAFGWADMKVDFTGPPAGGGGPGAWDVGDVWNCQAWFRDPPAGGANFNLSDGLSVTVCP